MPLRRIAPLGDPESGKVPEQLRAIGSKCSASGFIAGRCERRFQLSGGVFAAAQGFT